jgi:IS30 family transposase
LKKAEEELELPNDLEKLSQLLAKYYPSTTFERISPENVEELESYLNQ